MSATTIFIAAVRSNGAIFYPAGYGYDPQTFSNAPEHSLDTDSPASNMLRTQTVIEGGSWEQYPFADRNNAFKVFPNGFESSFAIPFFGFGGAVINFSQPNELTQDLLDFFQCIGLIVGLYCSVSPVAKVLDEPLPKNQPEQLLTLTPRQWQILEHMQKGATNISIARILGFSESTIRHETMRIYRKLNLRGRMDLPAREQNQ
ncbi:MAG: helix-turn-helix transcriptional regulator [Actinomycetes bacterium]